MGRMPTPILDNGVMGHRFSGHWFRLHTRDRALMCPLTETTPLTQYTHYLAEVAAQIRRAGAAKWTDVTFTFDIS